MLHLHASPLLVLQDSVLYHEIITSEEIPTSDFGLDPGWRGKMVSETEQFLTFLIYYTKVVKERKKVVSQKVFARKMLKSASAIAMAMTGSMARCRPAACHSHITAGSCPSQLRNVVTCRVYWPSRR